MPADLTERPATRHRTRAADADRRQDARPTAAAGVVDLGGWLAGRRRPDLPMPTTPVPPPTREGTGATLRIAMLEGQVDVSHPDLRGARIRAWSMGRSSTAVDPTGGQERATAYASLLVGQGAAHVRGLVPAAELLVASVLGVEGRSTDELVAMAVRWALACGAQALVVPFSRQRLGRRVALVLRSVAESGTPVFAAAGDLGPGTLAFPGSVTGVLAVTAHDDDGLLPRASALGDVAAPGRDVPASGPGRATLLQGSAPAAVLAAGSWGALRGAHPGLLGSGLAVAERNGGGEAGQRDRFDRR